MELHILVHMTLVGYGSIGVRTLNVVHHIVFYNNGISTKQSVKHNCNINTKYTIGVATCFGI
jgi:hypothetical protein